MLVVLAVSQLFERHPFFQSHGLTIRQIYKRIERSEVLGVALELLRRPLNAFEEQHPYVIHPGPAQYQCHHTRSAHLPQPPQKLTPRRIGLSAFIEMSDQLAKLLQLGK